MQRHRTISVPVVTYKGRWIIGSPTMGWHLIAPETLTEPAEEWEETPHMTEADLFVLLGGNRGSK